MHSLIITFVGLIPGLNKLPAYTANAILISLIMVILVLIGTAKLRKGNPEDNLIPEGNFTIQNLLESMVEMILKLISDTMEQNIPVIFSLSSVVWCFSFCLATFPV